MFPAEAVASVGEVRSIWTKPRRIATGNFREIYLSRNFTAVVDKPLFPKARIARFA